MRQFQCQFLKQWSPQPVIPPTSRVSVIPRGPITERFRCTCEIYFSASSRDNFNIYFRFREQFSTKIRAEICNINRSKNKQFILESDDKILGKDAYTIISRSRMFFRLLMQALECLNEVIFKVDVTTVLTRHWVWG